MNRNPPAGVKKQLRLEVGFGCPVPNCGNPYLTFHHFDPPWMIEQHHNPNGMIALCAEHHAKADNGAYTREQLIAFKNNKLTLVSVKGQFDWRRNKLLTAVGGNYHYEGLRVLSIDEHDVVWLTRDGEGNLLLNVKMLSLMPDRRAVIIENCWESIGSPVDLISPPNGRELTIKYENGDSLHVEFFTIDNAEVFKSRFNKSPNDVPYNAIVFPLTVVEVNCEIGGTDIKLTSSRTKTGEAISSNCWSFYTYGVCHRIRTGMQWRQNWDLVPIPKSRLSPCPCGNGLRYKHCHGRLSND